MVLSTADIEEARRIIAAAEAEETARKIALLSDLSDRDLEEAIYNEDYDSQVYEAARAEVSRREKAKYEALSILPGELPMGSRSMYSGSIKDLGVGDFLRMQARPGALGAFYVEVVFIVKSGLDYSVSVRKTNTDEPLTEYTYDTHTMLNISCPHMGSDSHRHGR